MICCKVDRFVVSQGIRRVRNPLAAVSGFLVDFPTGVLFRRKFLREDVLSPVSVGVVSDQVPAGLVADLAVVRTGL